MSTLFSTTREHKYTETNTLVELVAKFHTAPYGRISALFLNNFGSVHRTALSVFQGPGQKKQTNRNFGLSP